MSSGKLAADSQMGAVYLTVADLERAISFYRSSIGLELTRRDGREARLGTSERELVCLTESPGAVRLPGRTGLYHFALLVPSRRALGNALRNLIATDTRLTGGADHLVSEALYLDDPDGNGIEIYRDRPREEWKMVDGRPQMATLPLDYEGILAAADGDSDRSKLSDASGMGHVHLHVAHLDEAVAFYEDVIGFDLQLRYGPSAAFLSAGGYHHHLGLNTWAGVGAPPPEAGSPGLRYYTVELPNEDSFEELQERLRRAEKATSPDKDGLSVRDPSQNTVRFVRP